MCSCGVQTLTLKYCDVLAYTRPVSLLQAVIILTVEVRHVFFTMFGHLLDQVITDGDGENMVIKEECSK